MNWISSKNLDNSKAQDQGLDISDDTAVSSLCRGCHLWRSSASNLLLGRNAKRKRDSYWRIMIIGFVSPVVNLAKIKERNGNRWCLRDVAATFDPHDLKMNWVRASIDDLLLTSFSRQTMYVRLMSRRFFPTKGNSRLCCSEHLLKIYSI